MWSCQIQLNLLISGFELLQAPGCHTELEVSIFYILLSKTHNSASLSCSGGLVVGLPRRKQHQLSCNVFFSYCCSAAVFFFCCCSAAVFFLLVLLYSVMSSSTLERLLLCVFQQYVLLVSCLASRSCESIIIPDYHKPYHPWCPICISHPGHNKDGQPIYSNWLNARCNEQLMTLFTFYTLMILSSHTTMAQENSLFKSFTTFPEISGQ